MRSTGPCQRRDRLPHLERKITARFYFQEYQKNRFFSFCCSFGIATHVISIFMNVVVSLPATAARKRLLARVLCAHERPVYGVRRRLPHNGLCRLLDVCSPGRNVAVYNTHASLQSCPHITWQIEISFLAHLIFTLDTFSSSSGYPYASRPKTAR